MKKFLLAALCALGVVSAVGVVTSGDAYFLSASGIHVRV